MELTGKWWLARSLCAVKRLGRYCRTGNFWSVPSPVMVIKVLCNGNFFYHFGLITDYSLTLTTELCACSEDPFRSTQSESKYKMCLHTEKHIPVDNHRVFLTVMRWLLLSTATLTGEASMSNQGKYSSQTSTALTPKWLSQLNSCQDEVSALKPQLNTCLQTFTGPIFLINRAKTLTYTEIV